MDIQTLKKLREETGASIMECKKALEEAKGDSKRAKEYLKKNAVRAAEKKVKRETFEGIVASYIHSTKRMGSLVEVHCETDFVARTPEFEQLASELALQVAGMNPKDQKDFLNQPYVRDPSVTIAELISKTIRKVGENIEVRRFTRYEV